MGLSINVPVSNPKKEITVNFNIEEVKSKMKYLCRNSEYFKKFDDSNSIIGEYKIIFKTPLSGLVDLGMIATINLTEQSETKTKIDIEVADNADSIDDSYELKSAQMLIDEITKSFGFILSHSAEELEKTSQKKESGFVKFLEVIGWIIVGIISISGIVAIFA